MSNYFFDGMTEQFIKFTSNFGWIWCILLLSIFFYFIHILHTYLFMHIFCMHLILSWKHYLKCEFVSHWHIVKPLNGGLIMVNFYTPFLTCNETASLHDVIREYLVSVCCRRRGKIFCQTKHQHLDMNYKMFVAIYACILLFHPIRVLLFTKLLKFAHMWFGWRCFIQDLELRILFLKWHTVTKLDMKR